MRSVQVHKSQLITDEHCTLNKALHAAPRGFGRSGRKHVELIARFCLYGGIRSILDYGCGQGTFKTTFKELIETDTVDVREYDPAIEGKDELPEPADLVLCTDVLEHVEPRCIGAVLDHLAMLTLRTAYIVVSLVPANKTLPDGRNAHLIVQSHKWWHAEFKKRWKVLSYNLRDDSNTLEHKEMQVWLEKRRDKRVHNKAGDAKI